MTLMQFIERNYFGNVSLFAVDNDLPSDLMQKWSRLRIRPVKKEYADIIDKVTEGHVTLASMQADYYRSKLGE